MSTGSASMLPRVSAPHGGVVLVLQALDEGGQFLVALLDLTVDLGLRAVRVRTQGVRDARQDESCGGRDGLQDGQRGVRVRGTRDVVRNVRGNAQDVVVGLHEAVLDECLGAAGNLRLLEGAALARDEVGAVAVRGEAHRPGVRDAHRDAVEVHRQPYAEALHDLLHRHGETLPLDVRLGAAQQQEGRSGGVLNEPDLDGKLLVLAPPVALEGQQRAAGAVVHQSVVVEAGDDLVGQRVEQPVDDLVAGLTRVDVSVEVVEHDKSGRLLGKRHVDDSQPLRLPCVQTLRIKHLDRSSSCSYCTTPRRAGHSRPTPLIR